MAILKVTIEREECISCGACWEACPEFFNENPDDGLSCVMEKYRLNDNLAAGEAPEELKDCLMEAAESCPVEIIQVEIT